MIALRLPAATESIGRFAEFVLANSGRVSLSPALRSRIELVIEELVENIAQHAARGELAEAELRILRADESAIEFSLADWGPEFNLLERPDPDLTLDVTERPIGGLGIYLVKQSADRVTYRREAGANMVTVLFVERTEGSSC